MLSETFRFSIGLPHWAAIGARRKTCACAIQSFGRSQVSRWFHCEHVGCGGAHATDTPQVRGAPERNILQVRDDQQQHWLPTPLELLVALRMAPRTIQGVANNALYRANGRHIRRRQLDKVQCSSLGVERCVFVVGMLADEVSSLTEERPQEWADGISMLVEDHIFSLCL